MLHDVMGASGVYAYPIWAVGGAMAAGTIGAVALVEILATRLLGHEIRRRHNDLTAAIFTIVGTTYAVLLAFVAMLAWENFDAASAATSREATSLADVASLAPGLQPPAREQLLADLRDYAALVQTVEWPAQASGHLSSAAGGALTRADALLFGLRPADPASTNLQAALFARIGALRDARDLRIAASHSAIPGIVWFVVVIGGAISLVFAALLGPTNRALHLALGAMLALSGTLVLVMIVALSHPFRGNFRITSEPFSTAVGSMQGG